ncbi:dTDP-glucose 4,6-dehydratase [Metabacillus indicus]|uniref:dTDP-glucose 4,6-dehydratase n=1 Tax=Metabacillus indicus TaxID=246786 RepID=UPI003CEBF78B
MTKHVLISGGAGFIGANFIAYLLKNTDYTITNADCLTYAASSENIQPFNNSTRYRFIPYDISCAGNEFLLFDQKYEVIINFAAETHVDRSISDASPFITTNINGTFHLLQAVLTGKASKMIQISTDEVYGSLSRSEPPFTEQSALLPNNPYSASKASADLLVRSYYQTHSLPVIITRCSNNYGPMQHLEKFIPKVITHALNDKKIPLYGDGMNIRDWVFVEDHCRAIHMVLEQGEAGEVYNIGGNTEKTNREVIEEILKQTGKDINLIEYVEDRKGHDRRYAIDSSKIEKDLGWSPSISFHEGIKRTIEWYRQRLG